MCAHQCVKSFAKQKKANTEIEKTLLRTTTMMIGRSGWSNLCTSFQKTSTKERVKKITFVKEGKAQVQDWVQSIFLPLWTSRKKRADGWIHWIHNYEVFSFRSMITEIWHDIEKVFILELFFIVKWKSERSLRLTVWVKLLKNQIGFFNDADERIFFFNAWNLQKLRSCKLCLLIFIKLFNRFFLTSFS